MDRKLNVGARQYRVVPPAERKASFRGEGFGWITVDGETRGVEILESGAHHVDIVVDGIRHVLYLVRDASGDGWWVSAGGRARHIREEVTDGEGSARGGAAAAGRKQVTPSFPATVVKVMVAEGDEVNSGQPLVVVSAMKMEMTLTAPYAGVVTAVNAEQGATVAPGDELVVITASNDGEEADEQ